MLGFKERGHGPALLFIHAYPLDSTMWSDQLDHFSTQYRVIAPDLPGFGDSPPARPWTMEDVGAELLSLLDSLEIAACTLVGLSIGGYIALPFTLEHPDRVHRLVLAHTRARGDLPEEKVARNTMIEDLRKGAKGSLSSRMVPRLLAPHASPDVRERVATIVERASAEACIHAVTAMRDRKDQTARLSRLTCPTLVIAGGSDAIIKAQDNQELAAAIPGGEITVLPNSGHLSNLEDPTAFNSALEAFLRRSDPK